MACPLHMYVLQICSYMKCIFRDPAQDSIELDRIDQTRRNNRLTVSRNYSDSAQHQYLYDL